MNQYHKKYKNNINIYKNIILRNYKNTDYYNNKYRIKNTLICDTKELIHQL